MDPLTLAVVGAAYGTSIAIGISRADRSGARRSDRWLAGFLACAVVAIVTIIAQHRIDGVGAVRVLERFEYVATFSSGPMLFLYIRSFGGAVRGSRAMLHFVPAVAAAVLPGGPDLPIALLIVHQVSYSALSLRQWMSARPESRRDRRVSLMILTMMFVVHIAQLVRMATAAADLWVDIIPVTISLSILSSGLIASVLWVRGHLPAPPGGRGSRRAETPGSSREQGLTASSELDSGILQRLEKLMSEEHLYRQTDLGLHDLAGALGITAHQLSGVLNGVGGTTLLDLLTRYRLEDAKRRLLDPGHEVYTIEAIGEMSGFGSRSSFHAIFRRELGTTPARFRSSRRS